MKHDVYIKEPVASCYANLVLLNRLYAGHERRRWARARREFLEEEMVKNSGKLICYYCGKDDLKMNEKPQVTVDHKLARALGGDEFDKDNFAACCFTCNRRKGSETEQNFVSSRYLTVKKTHYKS